MRELLKIKKLPFSGQPLADLGVKQKVLIKFVVFYNIKCADDNILILIKVEVRNRYSGDVCVIFIMCTC
jgi:hypothetical protein